MHFGMPTLLETPTIEACANLCRELGLDFVELNMNLPAYQADRLETSRFAEIAQRDGIYYTIHLDENLNPCDFNERVAKAYTETVLQTMEAAKRLAVPVMNMHLHSGVWFTLPDRKAFLFDVYEEEYLQKLSAFREACAAGIGNEDMKICVENCGDYAHHRFLQTGLALLLERPVFGLTFDIGHNASNGFADEPIIMQRADRLLHMHVHDARGKSNHLPLGEGDLDLSKYLRIAKESDCRVVLETKTVKGLWQSVAWLRQRGVM